MEMTVKDLLYACGNIDKKMLITVLLATGKELVSQKTSVFFDESPESQMILKMEVDYFKIFPHAIIILV
ncbi:MAG: hypothetical protein [Bacteriophage sp.]|nr:MAG: hypothetical protein [Bacteriophage sp.]